MILSIEYKCPECGYRYSITRPITDDNEAQSIPEVKQMCTKCGITMITSTRTFKAPYYSFGAGGGYKLQAVRFLNSEILWLQADRIQIDEQHLIQSGFCGEVDIVSNNKVIASLHVDPAQKKAVWRRLP